MKIYIVQVTPEASRSRISQEAYTSYEAAKAFIESRTGAPKPLRNYVWRDDSYTEYAIFEVSV